MSFMQIHSQLRDYSVHWEQDGRFVHALEQFPQRLVVVDENVWRCHRHGCLGRLDRDQVTLFAVSEERKNLEGVAELYDVLIQRAAKKNVTLVVYGGGILQDVAGFVASTLYRGIPWVFVPTTLLAQADSCIGSKTSLNYKGIKNLLGTFNPPQAVYIHTPFLLTQRDADYYSGLGEVIKLHIMGGADTTDALVQLLPGLRARDLAALETAVQNSLAIKHSYFAGDEFDTGRRNLLNYGHCFGHALEATSGFRIPHGQAVVFGMLCANIVAAERGILSAELADRLADELLLPGLHATVTPEDFDPQALVAAMGKDKKRTGQGLALVMLGDGFALQRISDLTPVEVETAIAALSKLAQRQFSKEALHDCQSTHVG
jgi:3-dehydroquinate synthase